MNPDVLQFQCSACKTVLTVPAQMAGVSGPCPVCGQTITSPSAPPPSAAVPASLFASPTARPTPAQPPIPGPAASPVPPASVMPGLNPVMPMPHSIAQHLSPMSTPQHAPQQGGGFLGGTPSAQPEPVLSGMQQPGLGQTLLGGLPPQPQVPAQAPFPGNSGFPPRRAEGIPPLTGNPQQSVTPWGGNAGGTSQSPASPEFPVPAGGSPLFPQRAGAGGAPSHSNLIPGSPTLPTLGAHGGANLPQNSLLAREIPAVAPASSAANPPIQLPEARQETPPASSTPPRPIKRPKRSSNIFMFALAVLFLGGFLAAAGWMFREPIMEVVNRYMPSKSKVVEVKLPLPDPSPVEATTPTPQEALKSSETTTSPSASSPVADAPTPPKSAFDPDQLKPPRAQPATPEDLAALQASQTSKPETTPTSPSLAGTPPKPMSSALQNSEPPETASVIPTPRELKIEVTEEAKPAADALMRFLTAKDLDERLKYTLASDMMKPLMERYYQNQPSGPVRVDAVGLVRYDPKPQIGGGAHAVFGVESRGWEYPVPVMLEETAKGFQVDWLSFVEFKDRILEKFFEGYQEGPARFHVGITRTHYFEDKVPNTDNKDAFRIGPAPPNPYLTTVFVEKDSQLGRDLRDRIPWGAQVWAIVDLEWVKLGNQQWVQLVGVPQLNWYSVPNEKKTKSGKTSELPNEIQRAVPVGR